MFKYIIKEKTDPVFEVNKKFFDDKSPNKQNLGIGEYRDESGNPYKLKILEKEMNEYNPKSFGYNELTGNQEFIDESIKLVFGDISNYVCGFQTPSGTGAISTLFTFLNKTTNPVVYCPNITWENHYAIGAQANLIIKKYDYSSIISLTPNLENFKLSIKDALPLDCILFQACCHNPTGLDPTREQWKEICEILKIKKIIPIFDLAYYGFGDGLDEDLWAVRYFKENFDEMFVCQSYSKIFGVYSERIGCLHIINKNSKSKSELNNIRNVISKYTRAVFGCCPKYFSQLIANILKNKKIEYFDELISMRKRLIKMRHLLYQKLKGEVDEEIIEPILKTKGFFHFFNLNEEQIDELIKNHIYFLPPGRICICGINEKNIDYISEIFKKVLKKSKKIKEISFKNKPDLTILITGAYGNITKSLYPILINKLKNLKIKLHLLGNDKEKTAGVKMQIEDCSFKNIYSIESFSNNDENAFKNIDLAVFCASSPYIKGCSRKDLFLSNQKILSVHADLIEKFSKGSPIIVVSNPVNSLASKVKEIASSSKVLCMTAIDEDRAILLYKENVYIWGNHSNPKVSRDDGKMMCNKDLKDRGETIRFLSKEPSTFSISKSLADLIYNLYYGNWKIHSIGICDTGKYDIPKNICFAQPVKFKGKFEIEPLDNIIVDKNEIKESIDSIISEISQ